MFFDRDVFSLACCKPCLKWSRFWIHQHLAILIVLRTGKLETKFVCIQIEVSPRKRKRKTVQRIVWAATKFNELFGRFSLKMRNAHCIIIDRKCCRKLSENIEFLGRAGPPHGVVSSSWGTPSPEGEGGPSLGGGKPSREGGRARRGITLSRDHVMGALDLYAEQTCCGTSIVLVC